MSLPFHPLADLFPLIEGREFDDLVADVRQHGVREMIVVLDGQILDGRNRYRAALAAGCDWLAAEERQLELGAQMTRHFASHARVNPDGDPLRYVLSLNMHRRHLSESQRAMVAARIANLGQGRPAGGAAKPANLPDSTAAVRQEEAAELLHVSERSVRHARTVQEQGAGELVARVERGEMAVSAAAEVARLPVTEQLEILRAADPRALARLARERREQQQGEKKAAAVTGGPINGARAVMASRREPDDSLDYFPTPPWATRALIEDVLPTLGVSLSGTVVCEPACGEGHISGVLGEYDVLDVWASDIFDYSAAGRSPPGWQGVRDYLDPVAAFIGHHWTITNPPFAPALDFVELALETSWRGVAMFVRSQWAVEGVERYERLFSVRPPTLAAFFSERVNLCKGRWDPEGTTATAYCWLVWVAGMAPRPPMWIPPGRRLARSRPDDVARFTAHPVLPPGSPASITPLMVVNVGGSSDATAGETAPSSSAAPPVAADAAGGVTPHAPPAALAAYRALVEADTLTGRHSQATAAPIVRAAYACDPVIPTKTLAADLGHPVGTVLTWAWRLDLSRAERRGGPEGIGRRRTSEAVP